MGPPRVRLCLVDVMAASGFDGGAVFQKPVRAWALKQWPGELLDAGVPPLVVWRYVDDQRLLAHVVLREMLPRVRGSVAQRVEFVGGRGNPVRWTGAGSPAWGVDRAWDAWARSRFSSVSLLLSSDEVSRWCSVVFPPRSVPWLRLHAVLLRHVFLLRELTVSSGRSWCASSPAVEVTQELFARLGPDGCVLLSEMLSERVGVGVPGRVSPVEFAGLVRVVESVCL